MSEYESYRESLEVVKDSDDSLYPDWLFKSVFNDFDDDYYSQSFAEDQISTQAKKLKRRYNDFFDWQDAMVIYEEYMNHLVEKYGSLKLIKNSLEDGSLPDYVPGKPKLKMNRRNKRLLRSGIIPSRRIVDVPIDEEETVAIARQMFPTKDGIDITDGELVKKPSKHQKRVYEKVQEKIDRKSRRSNMYRSVGDNRGTDFIVAYLNQAKRGVYDSTGYKTKEDDDDRPLHEKMKELIRIQNTPAWIIEEENESVTTIQNGRIVKRREQEQMEIYKELYKEGFNVIGAARNSMSKKSVKMIRTQIGATEPLTKKEMKKLKKRNKKDQKRIQRRQDSNDLLSQALLHNKLDHVIERDKNNNLTMRLRDMFPD